jgi:mannose-6-phosphate isomerase-like protein (cupin superfamily)
MKRREFVRNAPPMASLLPAGIAALLSTACNGSSPESSADDRASDGATLAMDPWQGTVLQVDEGQFIVSGRRRAPMRIKVDSREAPNASMSMLISEVPAGAGIPVHSHRNEDEIIFIHTGEGIVTLGDRQVPSSAGAMLYAPRGVWHGVQNTADTLLTWCAIWSPAGFEQYFVEVSRPPRSRRAGSRTAGRAR